MPLGKEKQKRIKLLLDEGELSIAEVAKRLKIKQSTVEAFTLKGETALASRLVKITDERNALKRQNKILLRENSLFQALKTVIHDNVTPIQPFKQIKVDDNKNKIQESLVLHLSDEHADSIIKPHQVGFLENFNINIALRRGEILVDTIKKWTQKKLDNHNFHTLVIFCNGDHVSGEIHDATKHSAYKNAIRNALAVGQLHACIFRDLAPYFGNIKIVCTSGNHGRRSIKKDYEEPWNNWDYLVHETARAYCKDIKNIEFLIPESFSVCLDIEGYGFCAKHGDDMRAWNGIPWYGIERHTRRLKALSTVNKRNIDYFCFGHFHSLSTQANLTGEILLNGAWVGTSPYVFNSMGAYNTPMQLLHGVHKDFGVTWRLPIKLKSSKEHLGPTRYHIDLAKEF